MNQTQQRSICSGIRDRRSSIFGHVRRLQESVPAHEVGLLHLAVNTRASQRPDDRPDWKRPRGRPRHTWNDPPAWHCAYIRQKNYSTPGHVSIQLAEMLKLLYDYHN